MKTCSRCTEAFTCAHKPAVGRGDMEPQVIVVFHTRNQFSRDPDRILEMRRTIRELYEIERGIYHTYLVRCQAVVCSKRKSKGALLEGIVINEDNTCLFTGALCDGVELEPDDNDATNCIRFLLEEVAILQPQIIIGVGETVSRYLFQAYGLLDLLSMRFDEVKNKPYCSDRLWVVPVDAPETEFDNPFRQLKSCFKVIQGQS
ncbi:MAG: uracil-DNA glycosylase family protein [Solirubrobacterales bacterium]